MVKKQYAEIQQDEDFTYGENIFVYNCAACHHNNMINQSTGSALGGITQRRDKKWLYKYVQNSKKMILEGDSIAVAIHNKNNFSMTAFPNLSDQDLEKTFYYIEKRYQMSLQGIPVPIRFAFNITENKKAKACRHILVEKKDILNVSVSKNRQWTFSCQRTSHNNSDWQKTTLLEMFSYDNSINEIRGLTYEFPAFRNSKKTAWNYKY
ncbi:c-type cytochrome [Kordia sp.]|uniref:c-type cytochrome n=1 Tax=Kordia sp. TaxID=1965332 RepID=UPI003B591477